MKRKLIGKEISICRKNLERLKAELVYNSYQKQICDLKLKIGLKVEYEKQVRDYEQLRREFEAEVGIIKDKISLLENQIRNGVDIKEEIKTESSPESNTELNNGEDKNG